MALAVVISTISPAILLPSARTLFSLHSQFIGVFKAAGKLAQFAVKFMQASLRSTSLLLILQQEILHSGLYGLWAQAITHPLDDLAFLYLHSVVANYLLDLNKTILHILHAVLAIDNNLH